MSAEVPDAPSVAAETSEDRNLQFPVADASTTERVHAIREGDANRVVLGRDALQRRMLAVADAAAAAFALAGALTLAGATPSPAVIAVVPLIVLISKVAGLYDRDEHVLRKTTLEEAPPLFSVATVFTLIAWLVQASSADGDLHGAAVLTLWLGLVALLLVGRSLTRLFTRRVGATERCLVVGDRSAWELVSKRLRVAHELNASLIGRVPVTSERIDGVGHPVLGMLGELAHLLTTHEVDRVIVCPGDESTEELVDTIRLVKGLGVKVSVLPRLFEVIGSTVEFDDLSGVPLLGLRHYRLSRSSALLKRALDICGALVGLVLLAPLLAVFALMIKLTSPGPVLFRQRRVGREGKLFELLKFRKIGRAHV